MFGSEVKSLRKSCFFPFQFFFLSASRAGFGCLASGCHTGSSGTGTGAGAAYPEKGAPGRVWKRFTGVVQTKMRFEEEEEKEKEEDHGS